MKKLALVGFVMSVGLGLPILVSAPAQAGANPCSYTQRIPSGAYSEPQKLPTSFAAKAKACGVFSKRTGQGVVVSFGHEDSTTYGWGWAVTKAIRKAGGHVRFVWKDGDGNATSGICKVNDAVCVWPDWG